jgi:hypothetical protein
MDREVKKVALVIGWIASSILLGVVLVGGPGYYVVFRFFRPELAASSYELGEALFLAIGMNIVFCFGALFGIYFMFSRLRVGAWVGTVAMVIGGMALSFLLALFVQPAWVTPGEYLAKKMFGTTPATRDLVSANRTQEYTDAACIFVLLTAVYLAAGRDWRKDDQRQT